MTPPKPRRPGPASRTPGSRTPASRPRRVAGTGPVAPPAPASTPPTPPALNDEIDPVAPEPTEGLSRTARGLLVAIVVLLVLALVEVVVILNRDDPGEVTAVPPSAERPVQLSELTVRSVVDQAAAAAVTILSASSSSPEAYDEQVESATAMMTDSFAEEYAATKAEIKDDFLAASTEVTVDVSAQGVVRAAADEVEALLFLTQTTAKQDTAVTPVQYRVTVTMLRNEDGWLVSRLEAK